MDAGHDGLWARLHSRRRGTAAKASKVAVESLEARQVLTGLVTNMATLPPSVTAGPAAVGSNDSLWFTETGASGPTLSSVTFSGKKTDFPLPAADASGTFGGLAVDPSGNVWYTVAHPSGAAGKLGRMTPSGQVTEFNLPSPQDVPGSATIGPDGNLWVAVANPTTGPAIDRVSADGSITAFPVAGATSLTWLTTGNNGNLWFVDGTKIGTMTTSGQVTEFTLPAPSNGQPIDLSNAQLTAGSDGNIWFIGLDGISKITPTGTVKTYQTPGTVITSLGKADDGNLWFTFAPPMTGPLSTVPGAVVARMTTDGITTVMNDRANSNGANVLRLDGGHVADLWMIEQDGTIGRMSLNGVPTYHPPFISPDTNAPGSTNANGVFSGIVTSFVPNYPGASSSDFTATINWADGQSSPGVLIPSASGGWSVSGTHTYTTGGGTTKQLWIVIKGQGTDVATIYGSVAVASTVGTAPAATTPVATTPTATTPASGTTPTATTPTTAGNWTNYPAGQPVSAVPSVGASAATNTLPLVSSATPVATPALGSLHAAGETAATGLLPGSSLHASILAMSRAQMNHRMPRGFAHNVHARAAHPHVAHNWISYRAQHPRGPIVHLAYHGRVKKR